MSGHCGKVDEKRQQRTLTGNLWKLWPNTRPRLADEQTLYVQSKIQQIRLT